MRFKPGTLGQSNPTGGTNHSGAQHRLLKRAVGETRRFGLMFAYLWALFVVFALVDGIILRRRGIVYVSHGFALINALVLAKVMLVAEDLNLGHWLQRRPLIYPILHQSLLLAVLFIGFHVLEKVAAGVFAGESVAASVPTIGGGGMVGLVCVAVVLFLGLIPFFAFRELDRELGEGRLKAMLLGRADRAENKR
jgi:hypothetical protein